MAGERVVCDLLIRNVDDDVLRNSDDICLRINSDTSVEVATERVFVVGHIYCTALTLGTVVVPCRIILKHHHV